MTNTIHELKDEARRLREGLAAAGTPVSHARSLELIARQKGYRDWNTIHAAMGNRPSGPPVLVGQSVTGCYLGQSFVARVKGVQSLSHADRYRITLDLDEPVDVVTFESFSSFRKRISATIDRDGRTKEKTSNGKPQLALDLGSSS